LRRGVGRGKQGARAGGGRVEAVTTRAWGLGVVAQGYHGSGRHLGVRGASGSVAVGSWPDGLLVARLEAGERGGKVGPARRVFGRWLAEAPGGALVKQGGRERKKEGGGRRRLQLEEPDTRG
jgi:hypothetical protein